MTITPDPNHVAVVVLGEGVIRRGTYFPAIAQQGKTKMIYGVTENGTANYGWRIADQNKIEYYVIL